MNKNFVCCYNVVVIDKYGTERYFHVRMSYLPLFIKGFVKNGTILSILGRVQEDCYDDFSFHTFAFSECFPF